MENEVDFLIKLTRIDQRIAVQQAKHIRRQTRKLSYAFREEQGAGFPENDDYFDLSSEESNESIDGFSDYDESSSECEEILDKSESLKSEDSASQSASICSATILKRSAEGRFNSKQLCPTIRAQNRDSSWDYGTAAYKQVRGFEDKVLAQRKNKQRSSLTKTLRKNVSEGCQTSTRADHENITNLPNTGVGEGRHQTSTNLDRRLKCKKRLNALKDRGNTGQINPELDAVIVKHLQSCGNWIKKRKLLNIANVGKGRRRIDNKLSSKWAQWMAHMQAKMTGEYLFRTEHSDEEDESSLQKEKPIDKWRRKAKLVRRLCGVCLTLRKYAVEAGLINNFVVSVSSRRLCVSGENGDVTEELEWDLENYKAKQEIPIPRATVEILEKLPQYRTIHDIQVIAMLMRSLPSFRKYTSEMQKMMCRIVRYMRCTSRRVVLRKGHVGYSVYFIVRGSVSVVMGKDDQSVFVKPEVVILRKGACFGEIALLQNTRRNATIVCAEDCEFLVIDKEDFIQNGLNQRLDQEFTYRYNNYRNWQPIQSWEDETVKKLAYCSRTEDFSHNKVIVQSSKFNEFLWFVVKGSCDVLRLVDLNDRPELTTLQTLPSGVQRFVAMPTSPRPLPEKETKKKRAQSAPLRPKAMLQRRVKSARTSQPQENRLDNDVSTESAYSSVSALTDKGSLLSTSSSNSSSEATLKPPVSELCRKVESKQHPSPIYVQVDQLRDGQCFGLESLFSDIDMNKQQCSLVSKGCVLIHVPRRKFLELTDEKSLDKIRAILKEYPDDHELIDSFLQKRIWDNFKQNIVEEVILDKIHHTATATAATGTSAGDTGLRGDRVEEYMKRKRAEETTMGGGETSATYGTMLNEEANSRAKHRLKCAVESRNVTSPSRAQRSCSRNNSNNRNAVSDSNGYIHNPPRLTRLLAAERFTPTYPKVLSHHQSHTSRGPTLTQRLNGFFRSSTPHVRDTVAAKGTKSSSQISLTDNLHGTVALDTKLRHLKSQSTVISSPRKSTRESVESKTVPQLKSRSIVVTSKEKREVETGQSPRRKEFATNRPQTTSQGLVYKISTPRITTVHSGPGGLNINGESLLKSSSVIVSGQ